MSTVNFSVPDDVKEQFNAVCSGQNKSAKRKERSRAAIGRILARRETAPTVSAAALRKARWPTSQT